MANTGLPPAGGRTPQPVRCGIALLASFLAAGAGAGTVLGQTPKPAEVIASGAIRLSPSSSPLAAVAIDRDQRLYLLQGTTLVELKRQGDRLIPGQATHLPNVANPSQLQFDQRGRLFVLDPLGGNLVRYRLRDGATVIDVTLPIPASAASFCLSERDSVYLLARDEGHLVAVLTPDGQVVRSFGSPFGQDEIPEMGAISVSFGPLACHPDVDGVIAASSPLGEVRRYTREGRLVWRHRLADYRAVQIVADDKSATFIPYPGGTHAIASLVPAGDGTILVQLVVRRWSHGKSVADPRVETRILSLETGAERGRLTAVPRLYGRIGDDLIAVVDSAASRTVEIIRWPTTDSVGGS